MFAKQHPGFLVTSTPYEGRQQCRRRYRALCPRAVLPRSERRHYWQRARLRPWRGLCDYHVERTSVAEDSYAGTYGCHGGATERVDQVKSKGYLRKLRRCSLFLRRIYHFAQRLEFPVIDLLALCNIPHNRTLTSDIHTIKADLLCWVMVVELALRSRKNLVLYDSEFAVRVLQHILKIAEVRLVCTNILCGKDCVEFDSA